MGITQVAEGPRRGQYEARCKGFIDQCGWVGEFEDYIAAYHGLIQHYKDEHLRR